ncbi:fibronectin type III domain-containing protein [Candidatus Uhrbacteria bacterium]|nr:fibronectin type III domain-containing protein [Candidatus Uhrbacteria bacterium]
MKRLLFFLLIVAVVILGYLYLQRPAVDATGKLHADLYRGASDSWDPGIQTFPFRPQDIDGQTVGSSTAIRLEWKQPKKTYNHFLLTVTDPATNTTTRESGEHDRVSLDITGLKPDTQYVFALQACFDPRCQTWMIAQDETTARTPVEFWSEDKEPILLNP